MTIEQAKILIPEKDYVICEGQIYGVWRWDAQKTCLEIVSRDSSRRIIKAAPHECFILGECRISFDSSVHPPKAFKFGEEANYSIDVCMLIGDNIIGGYYSYTTKEWVCKYINDDNELDYQGFKLSEFKKWIFKPDYLK